MAQNENAVITIHPKAQLTNANYLDSIPLISKSMSRRRERERTGHSIASSLSSSSPSVDMSEFWRSIQNSEKTWSVENCAEVQTIVDFENDIFDESGMTSDQQFVDDFL